MASGSTSGKGGDSRPRLHVVDQAGKRTPFLRGMVTHDLVQRGLDFDEAYATAHALRDRLAGRDEVSSSELEDLVADQVRRDLGAERLAALNAPGSPAAGVQVAYQGALQPFSRGLLARSLGAAGLGLDRAYRLVTILEANLQEEGVQELASEEVALRVGELLERMEGKEVAARYRLVRRVHRLPKPLVLYLGGTTGTGKSTLALEIAPLFRIYRVNATDTIRQVMRMLLSPAILPAVHTSSFEMAAPGSSPGDGGEDQYRRLMANFEDQTVRICVGVRAMVERAMLENMSVVIEGVHLVPPHIPFGDLEGAVTQIPLLLTTLDEEIHRGRFLQRARVSGRGAERYLESFGAIRRLQEYLVQQAETEEVPIFDTSDGETAVPRAMRLLSGLLQQRLPALARPEGEDVPQAIPTLLLAIDGVADHPTRALGGRTPLAAADTPHLDRLAKEGSVGLADPIGPGVVPDTAAGTLAFFGQSPLVMSRGPVEALGAGFQPGQMDIALRGNLASLDEEGRVVDRRAGRIREEAHELAKALDRLPLPDADLRDVVVRVRASTEHRLAILLRGPDLSSAITGSDPGDGVPVGPPLEPHPNDPSDPLAERTARALALFESEARQILQEHPANQQRVAEGLLPANAVLTRGAGRAHELRTLRHAGDPLKVACISGDGTILGIARWLGAKIISTPGMTANLDTDLRAKLRQATSALRNHDLVVLHVKGADIAAHDRRPDLKVQFLERLDREVGWLLRRAARPLRIAVASDHATLSEGGHHAADPVPVLIWGEGIEADAVTTFSELAAADGGLGRFQLQLLLSRLFDLD